MAGVEFKNKGNEFFKKGQHDEAIAWYTKAVEAEPSNHVYYSNRAAAKTAKGDYNGAIEDGKLCIRCKPDWNKGYFRLATAQQKSGDYLAAYNTVQKGLKVVANDANLLKIRNDTEAKAKKQEELNRQKMPKDEQFKAIGNDHFKASKFSEAIEYYQKAIEIATPGSKIYIDSYNNMAACHQQIGNHQAVCEACSYVLEHDENNQKALLRRGLAFEALERFQLGLADIRRFISIAPSNPIANKAQHRLGQAVRLSRQYKKIKSKTVWPYASGDTDIGCYHRARNTLIERRKLL